MGTRDEYVSSLRSAFVTLGTNIAFTALIVEVPFLNFPVIRELTRMFIGKILNLVAVQGETAAFFLYIDTRVNKQASEFEFAAYANHDAQVSGTQEQKDAAEKLLFEKFVTFASLKS